MNWYIKVLKKYGVFHGRAGRKEFWCFSLVHIIIAIVLTVIDYKTGNFNEKINAVLFSGIYGLAVLIPSIAVSVRRFHDTGRRGWYCFLWLIPIIGWIINLVISALDSEAEENQYGPNPKDRTGENTSIGPAAMAMNLNKRAKIMLVVSGLGWIYCGVMVCLFFLKGQSVPKPAPSPVVVADTAASDPQVPEQLPEKETLWDAAATGELGLIKQNLDAGADINAKEPAGGSTPLIVAALFGQAEAVRSLLEGGADVTIKNNDGSTALHIAAFFGYPEIVKLLLDKDADVNTLNSRGEKSLQIVSGEWSQELEGIYNFFDSTLKVPVDLERIKAARPEVAVLLREHGAKAPEDVAALSFRRDPFVPIYVPRPTALTKSPEVKMPPLPVGSRIERQRPMISELGPLGGVRIASGRAALRRHQRLAQQPAAGDERQQVSAAVEQSTYRMAGVLIGSRVNAIMEGPEGSHQVVRAGDLISGVRVLRIERDRVYIKDTDGQIKYVRLRSGTPVDEE